MRFKMQKTLQKNKLLFVKNIDFHTFDQSTSGDPAQCSRKRAFLNDYKPLFCNNLAANLDFKLGLNGSLPR